MKRNLLLAMLIVGTITACALAGGVGGGLGGRGGAAYAAMLGRGYIPRPRGFWASEFGDNDSPYVIYDDAMPPSLESPSGTGFGHPGGSVPNYEAVNQEQLMAPPQTNDYARSN